MRPRLWAVRFDGRIHVPRLAWPPRSHRANRYTSSRVIRPGCPGIWLIRYWYAFSSTRFACARRAEALRRQRPQVELDLRLCPDSVRARNGVPERLRGPARRRLLNRLDAHAAGLRLPADSDLSGLDPGPRGPEKH